ncbi:MAG: 16S rRNA (guanine(527)-N(7))-methyltransferase RsmG [Candidatus Kapabacteria bacterium]|nr:16S rRNA (guanine(527)-N(7))-methyltransferase RsmG [Candidatus Kapabacteria bacterium]
MEPLELWTLCSANGIILDKDQIEGLFRYAKELVYWNQQVNMISRRDEENVFVRHIIHSLTLLTIADIRQNARCLDIGTGGGLPGIPIKLARPDVRMTLTDSITKKVKMTEMFAKHTGLKGIEAKNIRVEELANDKQYIGSFDVIMARAVAPISELVTWTFKLLKPKGSYVFLKGGDLTEEIADARRIYPNLDIEEHLITWRSVPWFEQEEKKVILAQFTR